MNARTIRGYAAALSVLGFTGAWALTAGSPRPGGTGTSQRVAADDPRVLALDARARILTRRAAAVDRLVAARTAAARRPAVRIVTLRAATRTSTS